VSKSEEALGLCRSGRSDSARSPGVLYETVEAETIIVNLDTGTYYDLNQTGSFILSLIERQAASGR